jgi:kinesin family protein 2/24
LKFDENDPRTIQIGKNRTHFKAYYDQIFFQATTQPQIFDFIKPGLDQAKEGINVTIMAYGQTGSGKTYTMMGNNILSDCSDNTNNNVLQSSSSTTTSPLVPGLYLLSAYDMFNYLNKPEYAHLELWVSFYEIYCNKLFDLLNNKTVLHAREDGKGNICIVGLIEKKVHNLKELMNIIDFGLGARTTGITGANMDSSRSHAIMQICIKQNTGVPYGKISFIDLAGSERAVDTIDTNKQTKIDGAEINKSLLALKECIRALDQEKRHTPFRGSKLTLVLRDSFIGNCLTLMIANISPCLSCSEHTLNTLRYADRVKELRKPKAERDVTPDKMKDKDPNEVLAKLLMMPRQHNKTVKYNVDIKGNNNNGAGNSSSNSNSNSGNVVNVGNASTNKGGEVMHINQLIKQGHFGGGSSSSNNNMHKSPNNGGNINNNNCYNGNAFNNNQLQINSNNNFIKASNRKKSASTVRHNNNNNKHVGSSSNNNNNDLYRTKYDNININNAYSVNNYISKYKKVEIKSDEDFQKLSSIHEQLINDILKEEDEFINIHKNHVDEMVESIKQQMTYITEVDKPGSDIIFYTSNVDKLLLKQIEKIQKVRERLSKFRIMLKDEEALASKFGGDDLLFDEASNTANNS